MTRFETEPLIASDNAGAIARPRPIGWRDVHALLGEARAMGSRCRRWRWC
jgi:hypothetical protein